MFDLDVSTRRCAQAWLWIIGYNGQIHIEIQLFYWCVPKLCCCFQNLVWFGPVSSAEVVWVWTTSISAESQSSWMGGGPFFGKHLCTTKLWKPMNFMLDILAWEIMPNINWFLFFQEHHCLVLQEETWSRWFKVTLWSPSWRSRFAF